MPIDDEQQHIIDQIRATFDYMPEGAAQKKQLLPWLEWQVDHMLTQVGPDDFTPDEMVALVGLIGPVFARLLTPQPAVRRPLRSVG